MENFFPFPKNTTTKLQSFWSSVSVELDTPLHFNRPCQYIIKCSIIHLMNFHTFGEPLLLLVIWFHCTIAVVIGGGVCVCVDIWQSIVCVIVSFWGLKTGKSIIDLYSWPKALVMVVVNEWPKPKPPWSVYDYGIIILWLHQLPSSPLTSLPYITLYYPSSVNNWSLAHLLCRCCISIEKLHVLPRLTSNNCFYRN